MHYIIISIAVVLFATFFYVLLFKCYPTKKQVNEERIKLIRNRLFV